MAVVNETRLCRACQQHKELAAFRENNRYRCQACINVQSKERYARNPAVGRAAARSYRAAHVDGCKTASALAYQRKKAARREANKVRDQARRTEAEAVRLVKVAERGQCQEPGCNQPLHIYTRQLCNTHYLRLQRTGLPLPPATFGKRPPTVSVKVCKDCGVEEGDRKFYPHRRCGHCVGKRSAESAMRSYLKFKDDPQWRARRVSAVQKRRVKKLNAPVVDLTLVEWQQRLADYGDVCAYCGAGDTLEMDHVWPISKGGSHTLGNVLPACIPCNRSKSARTLVEWLESPTFPERARGGVTCLLATSSALAG